MGAMRAGAIRADGRGRAAAMALATCIGLGLVVAVRWQVFRTAALDGVSEGLVFGLALFAVALAAGLRASAPPMDALAGGLAAGGVLVAVSVVARWPVPPLVLGHAASFLPWVAVTTLVATGEEFVLRGALWRWLASSGGDVTALLVASVLFALMHVPVYGWHVVPLDFGVGLWFGGLRLWFGGPAAPAAAHVLADLATWWL
jgi:membrane protease YdiL (CAAX protease family)